ncbi:MAG TPA: type II toxin-antitoxin system HipA family toxin [Verrucomicrobiae bacterium]
MSVWMNGEHVGEWRRPVHGGQEFAYADRWLASAAARPVSLSLPLRPNMQPYRRGVPEFFENLLPDNRAIRERIQRRFGASSTGAFDLLSEIGRDCVGAIQLLPEGHPPVNVRSIGAERLTPGDVGKILAGSLTPGFGRGVHDEDFRISLAGAQEKTALLWYKGTWHRPKGSTPTTHILKLPMGGNPQGIDLSTSVGNEWLCAQIVEGFGIPVARCRMEKFGGQEALVVERFDRRMSADGKWIMRLPQEDFCQATATPPALKYESDGGPGTERIMELLLGSDRAADDRRGFMRTQLVFWLLAAIDGHAKNFSIFLHAGGSFRLTPRYDILSAYPMLGKGRGKLSPYKIRMAMAMRGKNRHYQWREISARHWLETARRCGFSEMKTIMDEVIARTPKVLECVLERLPRRFPDFIGETILSGTARAARQLAEQISQKA